MATGQGLNPGLIHQLLMVLGYYRSVRPQGDDAFDPYFLVGRERKQHDVNCTYSTPKPLLEALKATKTTSGET